MIYLAKRSASNNKLNKIKSLNIMVLSVDLPFELFVISENLRNFPMNICTIGSSTIIKSATLISKKIKFYIFDCSNYFLKNKINMNLKYSDIFLKNSKNVNLIKFL